MKKNKNFIILILGQMISLFGSAIQRFSLSLYLLDKTQSAGVFANILAISMIPYVVCAPMAGVLADKKSKKWVMVWLDLISFAITGVYAIALLADKDTTVLAAIVMFGLSVTYTLYAPSVTATIPRVVADEDLLRANGIVAQIGSMANFLGPVLAGILYSFFGIKFIVAINAISFLGSAIMEMFMNIPGDVSTKIEGGFVTESLRDMKETYRYLKKEEKSVLRTIASYGMSNLSFSPAFTVVMPFVLNSLLLIDSSVYGIVEGVIVIGMITGGLLLTAKPAYFKMKRLHYFLYPMAVCFFAMSMVSIGIGSAGGGFASKWGIILCYAAAGFVVFLLLGISNIISLTHIQQVIPADKLGKVSAFSTAIATISVAPGQLLYGQLLESGMAVTMVLLLTTVLNLGVSAFVHGTVRKYVVGRDGE